MLCRFRALTRITPRPKAVVILADERHRRQQRPHRTNTSPKNIVSMAAGPPPGIRLILPASVLPYAKYPAWRPEINRCSICRPAECPAAMAMPPERGLSTWVIIVARWTPAYGSMREYTKDGVHPTPEAMRL